MTLSARLLVQPPVVVYTALPYTAIARSCFSIDSMTTVAARRIRGEAISGLRRARRWRRRFSGGFGGKRQGKALIAPNNRHPDGRPPPSCLVL
jgi:hypothetical protein